jgi:PTH1 family peptidyl-tRNA hydrolase
MVFPVFWRWRASAGKAAGLIVGLGNPGSAYADSRHNVGFRCLDYLAELNSVRFDRKQCQARTGSGSLGGSVRLLAKPETFVNLSGRAVGCLMRKHHIAPGDLLVICDDLDLPLGEVRLRSHGGSGGHNGMKSIISVLGSEDFSRIRVGIGRPRRERASGAGEEVVVNHVLGDFTRREEAAIMPAIIRVAEVIDCLLRQGVETAMSRFN